MRRALSVPRRPAAVAVALVACGDDDDTATVTATTAAGAEVVAGEPFPAARCDGQPGRRHDHLPVRLRLRGHGVDRRRGPRRGARLLRRAVPRRRAGARLLDRQLPDRRGRRGRVRVGRLVQRGRQVRRRPTTPTWSPSPSKAAPPSTASSSSRARPPSLEDLRGTTIGVKGAIPASVAAMLAGAGLHEGTDYQTVLLDGFDPLAHYELDGIVGFPGYKSNEPGRLERAGLPFDLFDPTEYDVPGSFGVIFTTRRLPRRAPDGRPGLPAGHHARPRRRHRRPGGGGRHGDGDGGGRRQPQLPVARDRVVPLADRRRPDRGIDARRYRPRRARPGAARAPRSTPTPRSVCSARATPPDVRRPGRRRPDRRRLRRRRRRHLARLSSDCRSDTAPIGPIPNDRTPSGIITG